MDDRIGDAYPAASPRSRLEQRLDLRVEIRGDGERWLTPVGGVQIELVDADHQPVDKGTVTFDVPKKGAAAAPSERRL